jgi:acetolactate synthase-1/2/3 large subunit
LSSESGRSTPSQIAAEVFLSALADHGVDFFFANPGTDFPPVIEAFSRAHKRNAPVPRPILVPHENLAVAMAHGAYLMTGRPQAVMVHVSVGTGNTLNNLANLSRARAPLLLAAGRTPITEAGLFGSRSRPIHWAQEMFDQAGMVRELVKWDYELRAPRQIAEVVARAIEVAMTPPCGPVYLSLPREPLSATVEDPLGASRPRAIASLPHPDPEAVRTLALWLAAAERPLIVTSDLGRDRAAVDVLATFAERWAVPVVQLSPRYLCLASDHAMHFGFDPGPMLAEADFVVVVESDVPWIPKYHSPPSGCRVAHVGQEPTYVRYPMRSFPSDLTIAADPKAVLVAIDALLPGLRPDGERISARRERLIERGSARRAEIVRGAEPSGGHISLAYASRCVGEAVGPEAIIFNEYPLSLDHCPRVLPGTYFGASPASGLGWALGAALGAKLACPEKLMVATIGDGTYLFTNPTACHWVGEAHRLPVLSIIFNNGGYAAVRRATLSMFYDGAAGEDGGRLLADLDPSPPYEELMKAQGGYGERVDRVEQLPSALQRARDEVLAGRQALVNVICRY